MTPTRRELLQQIGCTVAAAGAAAALPASRLDAAPARRSSVTPAATPTLIVVYLRGGADALSVIAPYGDKDYLRYRPSLALAAPGSGSKAVLPLDERFGFNPNLKELHELYEQGWCVPVVAVGSPHGT